MCYVYSLFLGHDLTRYFKGKKQILKIIIFKLLFFKLFSKFQITIVYILIIFNIRANLIFKLV